MYARKANNFPDTEAPVRTGTAGVAEVTDLFGVDSGRSWWRVGTVLSCQPVVGRRWECQAHLAGPGLQPSTTSDTSCCLKIIQPLS